MVTSAIGASAGGVWVPAVTVTWKLWLADAWPSLTAAMTTKVPVNPLCGAIVSWLPVMLRLTATAVFVAPVSSDGSL